MVYHLFFYQLVLVALVWLCVMLHWTWPSDPAPVWPTTPEPLPPLRKRKREPPPVRASPPSRIAMPVSTAVPLARRHPQPRHRASCPHGGAAARATPHAMSTPIRTVPPGAGAEMACGVVLAASPPCGHDARWRG